MIDFKFLTPFQITTFVLGIVFSILTLAVVFYTLRKPEGYRNTFLKVIIIVIIPLATFIMWFACVFGAYGLFKSNELYIMLLSIACAIALSLITFGIAALIKKIADAVAVRAEKKASQKENGDKVYEVKIKEIKKDKKKN